jgi:transcriptional regulator with XRE-family HTH domain
MADITKPKTWPQIVGERVRALRSEAGWSLEDLAAVIDRTEAEVRTIEDGQVDLSVNTLLSVVQLPLWEEAWYGSGDRYLAPAMLRLIYV